MPSMNITRPVTRTVTETARTEVHVTLETRRSGSVDILLNGQKALRITTSGYLRRFPGLTAEAGVNLLEDGRIAIKSASAD